MCGLHTYLCAMYMNRTCRGRGTGANNLIWATEGETRILNCFNNNHQHKFLKCKNSYQLINLTNVKV